MKFAYVVPPRDQPVRLETDRETLRQKTLVNCQIESPWLTYEAVWGDQ